MPKYESVIFILFIALLSCSTPYRAESVPTSYHFKKPDAVQVLPAILNEISGLTYLDSTTFACVQDEKGILFIYDVVSNRISAQYVFNIDGDYEGITRVGNTIFVLRSDGTLFEIEDYHSKTFRLRSYVTGIPASNNEGLCYDAANNRLLIAAKGKIGKGAALKDKRVVYGFDLHTKRLSKEAVYNFDLQEMKQFAQEHRIAMPVKSKKNGMINEPFLKFAISAICIHPFSKDLYLLSAADHLLFIFDHTGKVKHIEVLDPQRFNKAEGLTFFENGDMLITNEAQDKKPTLYMFKYQNA